MGKNVLIPISLMDQIIDLLESFDTSPYDIFLQNYHRNILYELNLKKEKRALRNDYAKMIHAKSDDARDAARIRYLQHKCWLGDSFFNNNPDDTL